MKEGEGNEELKESREERGDCEEFLRSEESKG